MGVTRLGARGGEGELRAACGRHRPVRSQQRIFATLVLLYPLIVDTSFQEQDRFHGPLSVRTNTAPNIPMGCSAQRGPHCRRRTLAVVLAARPAYPAPGSPAPLNRADNDPRFPRQALCCLVSLGFVWSKPFPACPILSPG